MATTTHTAPAGAGNTSVHAQSGAGSVQDAFNHSQAGHAGFPLTDILFSVSRACRDFGIAPSTFGRLVIDLRRGRALRPATEASVRAFIPTIATGGSAMASGGNPRRASRVNTARPSYGLRRDAKPLSSDARQHRAMMQLGSEMLLAAIRRERGETSHGA
jgi:hypothetical protein